MKIVATSLLVMTAIVSVKCQNAPCDQLKKELLNRKEEIVDLENKINSLRQPVSSSRAQYDFDKVHYTLSLKIDHTGGIYSVYVVNPEKINIEIHNKQKKGGVYDFRRLKTLADQGDKTLLFAMNGGMYKRDQTPLGLFVEKGKELRPIDVKKKSAKASNFYNLQPNGVFYIDKNKKAYVQKTEDFVADKSQKKAILATQSGPMLLSNGMMNTHFNENSPNKLIRNAVGVTDSGKVVFVISDNPVTFYNFSMLFKNVLKCQNALYLDGVVSRMYLPELGLKTLTDSSHLGPIITVIE